MSALAEALVAAQRRALTALQSAFVAGRITREETIGAMNAMGTADAAEQERLIAALDLIRELGAPLPAEPTLAPNGEAKPPEKASDAQLALIAKLVNEKKVNGPDLPLTKAEAHKVIDSLKDGTYDYSVWHVAF